MWNTHFFIIQLYLSIQFLFSSSENPVGGFERHASNEYDFIKYEKNKIEKPDEQNTMTYFYQALNQLVDDKNIQVDIVHIGDSHIQADFFTGKIRDNFHSENRFGNAGRGYFFPCILAQSNTPHTIDATFTGTWQGCKSIQTHLSCFWGLSGYTATTNNEDATFTVNANTHSAHPYPSRYVKVYYDVNDLSSFKARLLTPEKILYPQFITDDYIEFELEVPLEKITIQLSKTTDKQDHFTLKGISLENEKAGIRYHAVGVNGATVESFLRCNKLESHLQSLNPMLVVISLGANDTFVENFDAEKFKQNYGKLIEKIRSLSPKTVILLTTPSDAYFNTRLNRNNIYARTAILELSQQYGCAVWDFFTIMGGYSSILKWQENGLAMEDKLHFSPKGYDVQGDLFYDALLNDYAYYYGLDK